MKIMMKDLKLLYESLQQQRIILVVEAQSTIDNV